MEAIWDAALRHYLAPALVLLGGAVALRGVRACLVAIAAPPANGKGLRLMRGFRGVVAGGALACLAAGWLWQIEALAVAAALIGAGELLETSVDVWALQREQALRARLSASPATPRAR